MPGDAPIDPVRERPPAAPLLAWVTACALGLLALTACHTVITDTPPAQGPYALVLGSAQDAGLPQIGCRDACCEAARADPRRRRFASCLLIVDPASGGRWLLDAGPDLREQVERMRGHPSSRRRRLAEAALEPTDPTANPADVAATSTSMVATARPPLVDGIFLTHAHMGHVAGLLHLGSEAYAAREQPVYGTWSMNIFLRRNEPWALLVDAGHVDAMVLELELPVALIGPAGRPAADLTLTAFKVPHRDEVTDTVGFLVRGPRATLVYLPDIDKWERWDRPLEDLLAEVDHALVDGTFYADGELPGRDMASIAHPFIVETIERLSVLPPGVRSRVWFTHLNHSNPAADAHGQAAQAVRRAGMHVADDGDIFTL